MEKIAIIGSPGAGKTTLARVLSSRLGMKKYHLDRLFWKPDWIGKDREIRIDILQKLVQEKQWIIEGTYLRSSEPRFQEADTIIFLDIPAVICLLRVIKRHREERRQARRDIPEGCVDKLNLHRIYKLLVFSIQDRKKLERKLFNFASKEEPKEIFRLRSQKDIDDFLAQQLSAGKEGYLVVASHKQNLADGT